MRRSRTFNLVILSAALAALAIAPAAHAVKSNGKTVKVKISCKGTPSSTTPGSQSPYTGTTGQGLYAGSGCNGRVNLKVKKKKAGSGVFTLAAGQTKAVKVKLKGAGKKALKKNGKIKTKVTVSSSATLTAPAKLKIKLAKKK